MQGHSWTNPDDQRMLQALQNKLDSASTLPIMWQVSVWHLEPMEKKAEFLFAFVYYAIMPILNLYPLPKKAFWSLLY